METKEFLESVIADSGWYCLLAISKDKKRKTQKFYKSIDDLATAAANFNEREYNAYFALSTFKEGVSRKVDNVAYIKSFFLDLDCGPTKGFTTQKEALRELQRFCRVVGLPKPMIVNSGYGIHVYWPLAEAVTYREWYPIAKRFKKLCIEHNFSVDHSVPADAAQVLRVIGTNNYKKNTQREVMPLGPMPKTTTLSAFAEKLGVSVLDSVLQVPDGGNAVFDALIGNQKSSFKNILVKTQMGRGCVQLAHIVKNQALIDEPLWRAGLSIAKFCSDADKAAHIMSRKHPEYTWGSTEEKMSGIAGPYLCDSFDDLNPGKCEGCPYRGKIKSPISIGTYVEESEEEVEVEEPVSPDSGDTVINTYIIPKYPKPYFRGKNGGIYLRSFNGDGDPEDVCIYHNDLYVVKRVRDPELGESVVLRLHLPKDGVQEFTLPLSAVTSKDEFRRALSMQGVAVMKMEPLMKYTTAWINDLQARGVAEEAHRQFGWTNSKCEAFVLGDRKITATGVEFNPPSSQTMGLFHAFEPKGTLDDWKQTISFWNRRGFELQQYVIGAGFGSILMEFSNVSCAAMHLYSKESGVGKTTALAAAVGIWGQPDALILQERDTYNTKMNRGEVYHNLPWAIDEITNVAPHEASNMLYQFTSGQQRNRLTSSGNVERHRGRPWNLIALTTGNTSIVERISLAKEMPKAEAQRVLECKVPRVTFKTKEETDAFDHALHNNYGLAGPIFVQYCIRNLSAIKQLCADVQKRIDVKTNLLAENRFWSAHAAYSIVGLLIAKRAGLVDFDVKHVFEWCVDVLIPQNQKTSMGFNSSTQDILNDFFSEHISNILQIKSTVSPRHKGADSPDTVIIPEEVARGRLVARYETDTKLFFVKVKPLRRWCVEQQINYGHLVEQAEEHFEGKRLKVRLTRGTALNLPPADCLRLRFDVTDDYEDPT